MVLALRLSYRDVEELLVERGIEVDHVTVFRWVQRFTPCESRRPEHAATQSATAGSSTRLTSRSRADGVTSIGAINQYGQVIDVYVSKRPYTQAARRFFMTVLGAHREPAVVVTDRAPTSLAAVDNLIPGALHDTERYANSRIEADHGRLKARLELMRGLKCDRTASVIMCGHVFMQNVRRDHYELGVDARVHRRAADAFTELARTI